MKMFTKLSTSTAAALGLMAIGLAPSAFAQATPDPAQPAADPATVSQAQATPSLDAVETAPAGALPAGTVNATGQDPNAPVQVVVRPDGRTVTNGPVPDTQANREKFGGPMSHAGKKTQPAGN
jgi:hypothetical protein